MLTSADRSKRKNDSDSKQSDPTAPQSQRAGFREYTQAVDPVSLGVMPQMPLETFSPELYAQPITRVVPLDLSHALATDIPATSPALCAHFIRILPNNSLTLAGEAANELYYVLRGRGTTYHGLGNLRWGPGDFFTMPCGSKTLQAETDAVLYYVNDAPLLHHLGVEAKKPRFTPTLFTATRADDALQAVRHSPKSAHANRVSVVLVDATNPYTLSATPILWAMLGVLPQGAVQAPHRHQSVALDLVVNCAPGCYTLVGKHIDDQGVIQNPKRVSWQAGMAFTTPPGLWHAHYNESGADAHLVPIQDAGLHTYLRSLDIRFAKAADTPSAKSSG